LGDVRMLRSSSSVSPLMTGTGGGTASRSSPRTRPSSSSQCSRPAWTSVKGRRSSTRMVTRSGSSRITSARRISGSVSSRATTALGSTRERGVPEEIAATDTMRSAARREAPRTSTLLTTKSGDVSSQRVPTPVATASTRIAADQPATRRHFTRLRAVRRRRMDPTRCRATGVGSSPRSVSGEGARRGVRSPLFTDDPDLGLESNTKIRPHALASDFEQAQDVGRAGSAPVYDEVRVLGGDLRAVEPLASKPRLLDQARRDIVRRIFPDAARGGEGQGLRRLLALEALLEVTQDLGLGSPMELEPAPDEHGAGRRLEVALGEGTGAGLEFPQRPVRIQEVHGGHGLADPPVRR